MAQRFEPTDLPSCCLELWDLIEYHPGVGYLLTPNPKPLSLSLCARVVFKLPLKLIALDIVLPLINSTKYATPWVTKTRVAKIK